MTPTPEQTLGATDASHARRAALLSWLRERAQHHGLTTRQIVDVSGLYDGAADLVGGRAYADLCALRQRGLVYDDSDSPRRWWPT